MCDPVLRAPALLAALFALTAALLATGLPLVDDEGYLTYLGAATLSDAPVATFFFQKFHPSLSLFYAPVARLGWTVFLVAHALVGGLGVFLAGAVAARFGLPSTLASASLACSPVYLLAAASGQSNSDGITALLLGTWLSTYADRRSFAVLTGLALAASVWTRYEFSLAVGVLALHLLPSSRWPLLSLLGVVCLYLLAGSLYHHDPLWWLHFPPTLPTSLPGIDLDRYVPRTLDQLGVVATQLSLGSPLWLVALHPDTVSLSPPLRAIRSAALVTFLAMVVIPFARVLNFIHSPRYLSATLPFTVLMASAWSRTPDTIRAPFVLMAFSVPLAVIAVASTPGSFTWPLAMALALPALGWIPAARLRNWLLGFAGVTSLVLTIATTPLFDPSRASPDEQAAARWIVTHADDRTVYTNDQHIALLLAVRGRRPHYLVAFDIQSELVRLLNPRNGQRATVLDALEPRLYGRAVWACTFPREPPAHDALFVLGPDDRIFHYFPRAWWDTQTRRVVRFGALEIRSLQGDPRAFVPHVDASLQLSPNLIDAPCVP